jgi:hypothetical protein
MRVTYRKPDAGDARMAAAVVAAPDSHLPCIAIRGMPPRCVTWCDGAA